MQRQRWMAVLVFLALLAPTAPLGAQGPVVQTIYFYSPTCPNCTIVSGQTLPPLQGQYGEQLQILKVDISTPEGSMLFEAAIDRFSIPTERQGVPLMIIGETVMVGSDEIPAQLPALIESYLAAGGIDWPDLPGIETWASSSPEPPTLEERWAQDPAGNTLALVLLIAMGLMLLFVARPARWQDRLARRIPAWAMFAVGAIGLAAALYLTIIEFQEKEAFCGPVGRCNVVQQSQYARLFGVIPISLIGVLGYVALLGTYAYGLWGKGKLARYAPLIFFGMAWFGFLASMILTYMEPFVIGASCLWCMTSAVSMSLLLLFNIGPGWAAVKEWQKQRGQGKRRRYSRRRRR